MTEFKLRAWDKKLGAWADLTKSHLAHSGPDHHILILGTDRYIFQRHIGFKDRNDKEIYEGDIVKWHLDSRGDTATTEVKTIVDHNTGRSFLYPSINSTTEIVGNVYDNPGLLK